MRATRICHRCALSLTRSSLQVPRWTSSQLTAVRPPVSKALGPRTALHSSALGQYRSSSTSHTRTSHTRSDAVAEPTIYALSTSPAGRGAIAVIRLSGPSCRGIYALICPGKLFPKPRTAAVRTLYSPFAPPSRETILDASALVLSFPAPHSATGEDILELHVHGGPAVIRAVLAAVGSCHAPDQGREIRYAEPGEFSYRAFLHGRLSLPEVEALGDALAAETETQRVRAMRAASSSGALAKQYEGWRTQLLHARAELEALIDFAEDQHFDESPRLLWASVAGQVRVLRDGVRRHRANAVRGEMLREGISVALLGAPNAGKSSLLNRVIGREAAIVSREAGTTRDVVEVSVDLGGFLCRWGDTAGLRTSGSAGEDKAAKEIGDVEREGMRRAKARAQTADVVLVVLALSRPSSSDTGPTVLQVDAEVRDTARQLIASGRGTNLLVVVNKADLLPSDPREREKEMKRMIDLAAREVGVDKERVSVVSCLPSSFSPPPNSVSSTEKDAGTGDGIQPFLHALVAHFRRMTAPTLPPAPSTTATTAADHADIPPPSSATPEGLTASMEMEMEAYHDSLSASARHADLLASCLENLDDFLSRGSPRPPTSSPSSTSPHLLPGDAFDGVPPGDAFDGEEENEVDIVAAAEDLRAAAGCLARITGRAYTAGFGGAAGGTGGGDVEEVLGVVFEKFCVGK